MKTVKIFLILFLLVSIISHAQVMVQDNGLRQVETTITIHPTNPSIMAIAVIERLVNPSGRQSVIWVSTNNGANWTQKNIVDNAADPVLDFDQNGNLFFSYLERSEEEIYIIKSTDLGENWTDPQNLSNTASGYKADKEWLTVNKLNNEIYLVWIENKTGSPSKLIFAMSSDGGNQFSKSEIYSITSNTLTAPYIVTGDDGTIYISCTVLKDYNLPTATFDLIFTKSTDSGLTFDPFTVIDSDLKPPGLYLQHYFKDKFVLKSEETNEERSFRIYPNTSMVVSNFNENIYVIVNHKEVKSGPNITDTDNSDLVLYVSTDNGSYWAKKRILYWELDGYEYYLNDADQFFPSITSDEDGNIFCFFYNSLIEGSEENLMTKMSLAYSTDNGETFNTIDIDANLFDPSIGSSSANNFIGDYIQVENSTDKIALSYSKPLVDGHRLYYHSYSFNKNITVYNDVNNNNTLGDIFVDDIQQTNLPQTLLLYFGYHSIESPNLVSEWKFYKWQSPLDPINGSRIKKDNFIADEIKPVNSKFERTKPLTVRNYFEGGDGSTIYFGEYEFDEDDRDSPHFENAFIYNPPDVPAQYTAMAELSHTALFGTDWDFVKWEDGNVNRTRQEIIDENTVPEWKAMYKGQLTSDDLEGLSSNSQRKLVRTDDGIYHFVYESLG